MSNETPVRAAGAGVETLADLVCAQADVRGESCALVGGGERLSFAEVRDRARRVAHALRAAGVAPGDRVAYLARNDVAHLELLFGAALSGSVLVALNWRLARGELAWVLEDCQARVLVVGADLVEPVRALRADGRLGKVEQVIVVGDGYAEWRDAQAASPPAYPAGPDDVVLQLYTSGTTGRPKGAMLTSRNLIGTTYELGALWGYTGASVNLVAMPLFHIAGTYSALMAYLQGSRNVLLREVDPVAVLEIVPAERVTHVFLVPAVLRMLLDLPGTAEADWSSLELFLYGAAPISDTLLTRAMATLDCGFMQVYGLTEAGNLAYLEPRFHDPVGRPDRLRSCGRLEPWIEHRVVGSDGTDVIAGEVGELWVRSSQTTVGYWNNPDATAEAITPEGWLRTGDAVWIDSDGFLYLHDRIKDVVISGGENVYPAEVENVLMRHPAVADAAVIGVPDAQWGEVPLAVLVLRAGATVTAEEISAFTRSELAAFKCPRAIEVLDALPRNASGKVLKTVLREPHWAGYERKVN